MKKKETEWKICAREESMKEERRILVIANIVLPREFCLP